MTQNLSTLLKDVKSLVKLIRKKRLLEKLPFSKSTLHALLNAKPGDDDPDFLPFPRPIYLNGGRIPFWDEVEIDEWIAHSARNSRGVGTQPSCANTLSTEAV